MITAGIDMGAKTIKVVVLKDGEVAGKSKVLAGFDNRASAEEAFAAALEDAGTSRDDLDRIAATGADVDHRARLGVEVDDAFGVAAHL